MQRSQRKMALPCLTYHILDDFPTAISAIFLQVFIQAHRHESFRFTWLTGEMICGDRANFIACMFVNGSLIFYRALRDLRECYKAVVRTSSSRNSACVRESFLVYCMLDMMCSIND